MDQKTVKLTFVTFLFLTVISFSRCQENRAIESEKSSQIDSLGNPLAHAAFELTKEEVTYDPAYFRMDYPNGDVPANKGVCTDVVIRAYRKIGIDLQQLVHEDMKRHFSSYPSIWGMKKTDSNIDHRRVPNLMTFFERQNASQSKSQNANDYLPGDVVCWKLSSGQTHIGIVSNRKNASNSRYTIIHNIGAGQVEEDCLFDFTIIGHYRYKTTP